MLLKLPHHSLMLDSQDLSEVANLNNLRICVGGFVLS